MTRMSVSCLVWWEYRPSFYWTVQVSTFQQVEKLSTLNARYLVQRPKVAALRIPTGRRQTSWLFTKRGGVEFGTTENKSS